MRAYIKTENILKFGDIETQKQKRHQRKEPISIRNIDINEIVVSNKVCFSKKRFKYFIGYKGAKKIWPLYIFFYQKWVHIEKTLMKLNICLFDKRWWIIRKVQWNLGKS